MNKLNEFINVSTSLYLDYCISHDMSYVPSTNVSKEDCLEREKFTPTSRKWFIEKGSPRNEIGLGYDNINLDMLCAMKEDDRFAGGMWNSPLSQLAGVEWKGGATSLLNNMKRCI